jgi:ABC-type lipoprotein export system ATPase subunit
MSVISIRDLTKTYGQGSVAVDTVRHVDLTANAGEVVLIMGPSGSGKTTLLLMLGAMLRPTAGTISIDGIDVAAAPERLLPPLRASHFGFVFQDFNLLSALDALENVELACNLAGTTRRAARARAIELLARLALADRIHFRPDQLSGGEKQRVALARALANDPPVILADEPTATSTPDTAGRSPDCSANSPPRMAAASSSSPTTTDSSPSPTASCSWRTAASGSSPRWPPTRSAAWPWSRDLGRWKAADAGLEPGVGRPTEVVAGNRRLCGTCRRRCPCGVSATSRQ